MAGTIHSTDYHINGASGDIAHFSTNDKVVHIFDDSKKDLGTLRDLYVRGKALSGVDFKTIKVTGLYTITGIKNVPGSVDTSKPVLLQVTAIGSPNSPDMVFYRLIDNKGNITECTVAGSNQSEWASGGVELKQIIDDISDALGNLSKLNTETNISLTDSINEVNSKAIANASSINDLTSKFNSHNHDDRYLRLDGKNKMSNNLILPNYKSLYMENSKGVNLNTAYASKNDELIIGDNGYKDIKMQTKGKLYVNGHQVYTDANAGQGSGIDADKLDGVDSARFARLDKNNIFNGDITISDSDFNINTYKHINFRGVDGQVKAGFRAGTQGGFVFQYNGTSESTQILSDGTYYTESRVVLDHDTGENAVVFKNKGDNGIGFVRGGSTINIYNWNTGNKVASLGSGDDGNLISINQAPYIQGRRLFLQSNNPGKAAKGSVWIQY